MKIPSICEDCPNSSYFEEDKCWYYWEGKKECMTGNNIKRGDNYAKGQQDKLFNRTSEQNK